MKQTLHIFAKDTRRFWPEILISVVVTFAFALIYPNEWRVFEDPIGRTRLLELVGVFALLVPASYWLLIARVVHGETLVGDSQFWITRPYEWKKLLAAKVVFLATWIGVPFLIGQFLLLAIAGFHPLSYVSVMLVDLFIAVGFAIVPLFAIAAVTTNFARMTLTLLGGFLAVLLLAFGFTSAISIRTEYTAWNPYENHSALLVLLLLFFGGLIAVVLQYATRRVWLSRGVIIATGLILFAVVVGYRCPPQSVLDRAYAQPISGSAAPVEIALATDSRFPVESRSWDGKDYVDFHIRYSGIAEGYAVFAENFKFTLTAANGDQWTSPWQQITDQNVPGTGSRSSVISLPMSPAVFERFQSAPVTLRITFGLRRLQADMVTKMAVPSADVAVPGLGFCMPRYLRYPDNLNCRSVLRQTRLTRAVVVWSKGSCGDSPTPENTSEGDTWVGEFDPAIDFSTNSVLVRNVFFSNHRAENGPENEALHWRICPGSPLTLTQYHLVDRSRVELTIPNFQIPPTFRVVPGN